MLNPPKRILIIEDDELITQMYRASLATANFELRLESDGASGWAALQSYIPDLVILDIMMPKLSGIDVLKLMRATPSLKDVPVIVMSSLMDDDDKKRALDAGASEYWIKRDVKMTEFEARILQVLANTKSSSGNPTT